MEDVGLYNSRIMRTYIEYVREYYPTVDIDRILNDAGIGLHELEDEGHWLTQQQHDLFHEILTQRTGAPDIARQVGRFMALSQSVGTVRQFILSSVTPTVAFSVLEKFARHVNRAATFQIKKLASNKIEITSTPRPGVNEKPYQCENRMGTFEAMAKAFTKKLPQIDHPVCKHRGGDYCRYIITWEETPFLMWRRLRNYAFALIPVLCVPLCFFTPLIYCLTFALFSCITVLGISFYSEHLEKRELTKQVESRGDVAGDLLEQINLRYNNALLVQELGQAFSSILDIDKLLKFTMNALGKRLDFDRGMIMLANKEKSRLVYTAGYGYKPIEEELLKQTEFHLDKPQSKGQFVQAFKEHKTFLVSNIKTVEKDISKRSFEFAKRMGVQSFICVPIVYEKHSKGVLAVDNLQSERALTQSDMSLLSGIANQVGISINNAKTYEKIRESEERFRTLSNNAPDIIYTLGINGLFTYVNPAWEKILGHRKEEVVGKHFIDFIKEEGNGDIVHLIKRIGDSKKIIKDANVSILDKGGHELLFTMNNAPNFDLEGNATGIVGTLKNITELKRSEIELKKSFEKLQMAMNSTINAMSMITESRDPYTAGHQKRVADLATAIAEEMDLPIERINIIHMASLIHDIGKIQIPAEILVKPGKLSEIEFSMIKSHPEIGYNILKTVEFTPPIAEIVLQHHERLDGSGYPKGISGNEILLESRIIAVADVVEAMASHRPYRPSLGTDNALKEITCSSGICYDPDVVNACLRLFEEKGFEFKQDRSM